MRICRIRLSCEQSTWTPRRNQVTQAKLLKERVETDAFGRTIRTLTAAMEMNPQTFLHVGIDTAESLTWIAELKVGSPTLEIPVEVLDENGNRLETVPAAGHIPQRRPFFLQGLLRWNDIQITIRSAVAVPIVSERVTQKIQTGSCLLQIDSPRLLAVQFQSHPLFQFRFDELSHRLRLIPREYDEVIGRSEERRVGKECRSRGSPYH